MLFAPSGMLDQERGGDTSRPSQVYCFGTISPSTNAVLVTVNEPMAAPPDLVETPFPQKSMKTARHAVMRRAGFTLMYASNIY
jgi:hypothetical protein